MITLEDYLGIWKDHADATEQVKANAKEMLGRVNALLMLAATEEVSLRINPNTDNLISGQSLGGFRPQSATIGAKRSKHKTGHAVDIFDPRNELDSWLTDDILLDHGLYREHPDDTHTWCHLQDVPPGPEGSPERAQRTFKP